MRFTLIYDGDLPPKADSATKWRIRRVLEPQLRMLWSVPPLAQFAKDEPAPRLEMTSSSGQMKFVPVIGAYTALFAELDILLLSASLPGGLLRGGDIDNRLKTLLDALSMPQQSQQIPTTADTEVDNTVFCLLEDDRLVTRLTIHNDRLLTEEMGSFRSVAVINVRTTPARVTWGNITLAG